MKHIIKTIIEKILYMIYAKEYKELYRLIDNYDYISFDIFDTLIKRNINNPTDIFLLMEKKYNIKNFKENRIEAEKEAHRKSNYEDVTLEEIYKELNNYSKKEKEKLIKLEIQIEKDFCTQNKPIYDFYNYCLENNKKIFLTSDMYLDINTVKEILNNSGYKDYENIYLSSKYRLRKRTGSLFKKLLKDENISKDKIIHIGDSITGDFLIPRKLGINTILIRRKINNSMFKSKKNKSLEYNILSSFINNNANDMTSYEHLGYEILGPMLYGFTSWIHEQVKKDKIDKLYFLARDAKIIMEIYKQRFKEDIPIYYLKVSRKSVIMATLGEVNSLDEIFDKCKSIFNSTTTLIDFINVLGLNFELYKKDFDTLKIKYTSTINHLSTEEKKQIFNILENDLNNKFSTQNKYFKEYLIQNNFNGNVSLIDIGWNGTIQYYINQLKNNNTLIHGYYYGVNKDKKYSKYKNNIRKGYLFDSTKSNEFQSIIYLSVGIIEIMFLSTEGTTLSYSKETNGKIQVISGNKEYSEKNLNKIINLQEYAKKIIKDIENSPIKKYLDTSKSSIFFENYKNLVIYPNNKNIKLFRNIEFQNFDKRKVIDSKSLLFYLFKPKLFYKDFINSGCKIMFMKETFKLNLPYYWILKKVYYWKKGK